ncbi:hypothetical protein Salat_0579700 [Sesamum alatum]|uniref:RNase H type-1 domain-containing protein n=1 Tax=Sesamum alatum TaxID=300844 RepID=A0AAE1YPT2_9LAMI|nr:hypothetical protein Salat_0579700 [Sesamum alatum]
MVGWAVWGHRNQKCFEGCDRSSADVVYTAKVNLSSFQAATVSSYSHAVQGAREIRWVSPEVGCLAVNFAGFIFPDGQGAGTGVFFRDEHGVCVHWDVSLRPHILEKSHAKALAARFAVELAGNFQGRRMEFQGVCPRLKSLVGTGTCRAGPIEPIVSDIRILMRSGVSGVFQCVDRRANTAVWILAKHVSEAAAHRLLPACVEEALQVDKLGIGL